MTTIVPKKERITQEIIRRLKVEFPTFGFTRGFTGETVTTYDQFFIMDLPESCELGRGPTRGQYSCTFPISISCWIQYEKETMFEVGNEILEKIRLAVETDERLAGLVNFYGMDEGAMFWYDEGVLDLEIIYVVEYTKDAGWVKTH